MLSRPIRTFVARLFPLYGTDARFRVDPALPPGLHLDPADGTIYGTPLPAPDTAAHAPTLHRVHAENRHAAPAPIQVHSDLTLRPGPSTIHMTQTHIRVTSESPCSRPSRARVTPPAARSVGAAFCDVKIECLSPPAAPEYLTGPGGVVRYYEGEELALPAPACAGTPPLEFSAQPELPPGLTLHPDGGITGRVPAVAPVFYSNIIIKVSARTRLAVTRRDSPLLTLTRLYL